MSSLCLQLGCCTRYVKHAYLINNCYPVREGDKGPKSSELSYLTFYASSRPAKLTKVGNYLERKVTRDIWKGRKQDNQVTLDIIKALIQECHRDLNLFSKNVIKIIDMILDTRDIQLVSLACSTFVVFCAFHDGSTLGVDNEFTISYENLIKKFAGFCTYTNADEGVASRMRLIGLKAMEGVVSSDALYASDTKVQLDIIIQPVLRNVAVTQMSLEKLKAREFEDNVLNPKRPSPLDNSHQENDVGAMALHVMQELCLRSNAATVRVAMGPLFAYLDESEKWWPPLFAVTLGQIVLTSLQPQYRYMLVSEVLQRLELVPEDKLTQKQATLVSMLASMLTSKMTLVGLSILEVLNSLINNLFKSLHGTQYCEVVDNNSRKNMLEGIIHQGLTLAIGGLATHIYYTNQMNDIISHIISKLRTNTTLEEFDGLPITELRRTLLKCLKLIVQTNKEAVRRNEDALGARVALEVWTPSLGLLADKDFGTRMEYAQALLSFLDDGHADEKSDSQSMSGKSFTSAFHNYSHGDTQFFSGLHQALIDYALVSDSKPADVLAIFSLLRALVVRFGRDEVAGTVPLVFKIQALIREEKVKGVLRQRALATLTVQYFEMVADMFGVTLLNEYIETVKTVRVRNNQWTPGLIFIDGDHLMRLPETFEEFESQMSGKADDTVETETAAALAAPVNVWIERDSVVVAIVQDGKLCEKHDSHGLELEAKLYTEYGNEMSEAHKLESFRIRSSRNLDELKPRLTTPLNMPFDDVSEPVPRPIIKVENLREALVAQQLAGDASDRDSDSLQSLSPTNIQTKKAKEIRNDVSMLLSSLSLNPKVSRSVSTTSLVNPPYKTSS